RESAELIVRGSADVHPIKQSITISTLPELGPGALDALAGLLAGVAVIDGNADDLATELDTLLVALTGSRTSADSVVQAIGIAGDVEARANDLRPGFVCEAGEIAIGVGEKGAEVAFRERGGEVRTLAALGAGIARWVAIAVQAAATEARAQLAPVAE